MKHTPATPLPWFSNTVPSGAYRSNGRIFSDPGLDWVATCDEDDAAYIAHACNAYQRFVSEGKRLVESMGWSEGHPLFDLLRELGELRCG